MTAQRLDGKALAAEVREQVKARVHACKVRLGEAPRLDVVLVGDDPASQVYVASKEKAANAVGIRSHVHRLPANASQDTLDSLLAKLSRDDDVSGVLLQLPLPKGLDANRALERLAPDKDVDGLHPQNAGLLALGRQGGLRPCTPLGCMRLLQHYGVPLAGSEALVIGRSALVGVPVARMLLAENATVTVAHSKSRDLAALVRRAEIVIAAAGVPGLVQGAWIKDGAAVVDVGIHRTTSGALCGDVDFPSASARAGFLTPVPGGVGPMTIAMLLENTLLAAELRQAGLRVSAPFAHELGTASHD